MIVFYSLKILQDAVIALFPYYVPFHNVISTFFCSSQLPMLIPCSLVCIFPLQTLHIVDSFLCTAKVLMLPVPRSGHSNSKYSCPDWKKKQMQKIVSNYQNNNCFFVFTLNLPHCAVEAALNSCCIIYLIKQFCLK